MKFKPHRRARLVVASSLLAVIVGMAPLACNNQKKADDAAMAATTKSSASKPTSKPVVAQWSPRPYPTDQVNLILFGDWGNGKPAQKDNAKAMANYVGKLGTQFNGALTVGDNFYVKMRDVDDWQFQSLFEDMYDAKRLNFPYYAAMGNHDFEFVEPRNGNRVKADLEREYAAKHPDSRWKCPAPWYRVDFPAGAEKPLVTALMLESSMPRLTPAQWAEEKAWIVEQLATTTATWKIACAHHPLFSNGSHGDNGVLQSEWGPVFKAGGLDFYIGGHDHDLQHLQIDGWPVSFVQAGGGGQGITDMRRDARGPFSRKLYGFVHFQAFEKYAEVRYVASADGKLVHDFQRAKDGEIRIVSTTGRDKATTKPLKSLIGVGENEVKGTTKPTTKPAEKK